MPKDNSFKNLDVINNSNLNNQKEKILKEGNNYTIGELRQFIREVVREAKDTAKVDSGFLKRSIRGAFDEKSNTVEFRQIYYGAENNNSKLTEIAERRMPKDIEWKVILETNMM